MSELIKIKQIENLLSELENKALNSEAVKITNNLSDVNAASARDNLSTYSKEEVDSLLAGANNAFNVANNAERDALTELRVTDRVFVNDDGDGKWALYLITEITNGNGDTSTYKKIADEDLFSNVITADAVKAAYESNTNTNAFDDEAKRKLDLIDITENIDLDSIKTDLAATKTTADETYNLVTNKQESFRQITENFTGLLEEPNTPLNINLSYEIKMEMEPLVFFNGVRITNVEKNGMNITFQVPFATEENDDITVTYSY